MTAINLATVWEKYKTTREWNKLSPNSQRTYTTVMKSAIEDYFLLGNRVNQITETRVDELYQKLFKTKPSHANMLMRVLRRVFSVAKRKGWVKDNPFREMGLVKTEPRTNRWSKEEVKLYFDTAWAKQKYDLAMVVRLCYEWAQRPGDIIALTRANFNSELTEVKLTQQKTGKKIHLPIQEETTRYLKAIFAKQNKIFSLLITIPERHINGLHREHLKEIGISQQLQIRDLRRTALIEMMESGATDAEAQAVGGHVDRQMLNIYAPPTFKMAEAGLAKRFS